MTISRIILKEIKITFNDMLSKSAVMVVNEIVSFNNLAAKAGTCYSLDGGSKHENWNY